MALFSKIIEALCLLTTVSGLQTNSKFQNMVIILKLLL